MIIQRFSWRCTDATGRSYVVLSAWLVFEPKHKLLKAMAAPAPQASKMGLPPQLLQPPFFQGVRCPEIAFLESAQESSCLLEGTAEEILIDPVLLTKEDFLMQGLLSLADFSFVACPLQLLMLQVNRHDWLRISILVALTNCSCSE